MRKRNAPGRRRTLAVMLLTAGIAGLTAAPGSPALAGEYTLDTARSVFAKLPPPVTEITARSGNA